MKTSRTVVSALFVITSLFSWNRVNVYATSAKEDNKDEIVTNDCIYEGSVEAVDAMIAQIGNVTLESKDVIDQARAAYDALNDEQRALCLNGYILFEAERTYQSLLGNTKQDMDELEQLDYRMGNIKDFSITNWQEINNVNNLYQTLTAEEKAQLTNGASFFMKYQEYLLRYKDQKPMSEISYDANIVDEFIAMIETTVENKDMYISQARNAYNALSEDQKQLVQNYPALLAAEEQVDQEEATVETTAKKESNLEHEDVETSSMQEIPWMLGFLISSLALLGIKKASKA